MIRAAYEDRNEHGTAVYRAITTDGTVWEASGHGNITRHREIPASASLGQKIRFEEMPIAVQKKILKAMGVPHLLRMWYLYSPISSFKEE